MSQRQRRKIGKVAARALERVVLYAETHPDTTQHQIAKALGLSRTYVNRLLNHYHNNPVGGPPPGPLAMERARDAKRRRKAENKQRVLEAYAADPDMTMTELARRVGLSVTYAAQLLREEGARDPVIIAEQRRAEEDQAMRRIAAAAADLAGISVEELLKAGPCPARRAAWLVAVDKGVSFASIRRAFGASVRAVASSVSLTQRSYSRDTLDSDTHDFIEELGELV